MSEARDLTGTATPPGTLAGRLSAARRRSFVGRDGELALMRGALSAAVPEFAVAFVHGPGGVGKTAFLRRLADEAAGRLAATIDGRAATPDPEGFTAALAQALGLDAHEDPLPVLHAGPPTLLMIDAFELLVPLDGWLRDHFLPQLPASALVVISSRNPPTPAWRSDPGWHGLVQVLGLRNLSPDGSRALLTARGVPPALHDDVLALAGGHPLALSLVADVVAQGGEVPTSLGQAPDAIEGLLGCFLADVPSPVHRDALEVCAHVKVTTEAMLRDVLPAVDAAGLLAWLRGLSFVESGPGGVQPHDLAREVLEVGHRWRDEDHYRLLHRRVRAHLVDRIRTARGAEQERILRELVYLHRGQPLYRPFTTWADADAVSVRRLTPVDVRAVVALAEQYEGPSAGPIVRFWAERSPQSVLVFERPGSRQVTGFTIFLELTEPSAEERAADAVVGSVWDWLRAHGPIRAGEHWFCGRMFVFGGSYGRPCAEFDLVQIRSALRWISDPDLAWSFVVAPEPFVEFWEPLFDYIDHPRAVGAEVVLDGRARVAFGHDWRRVPPAAWLELMGEREIALDVAASELVEARPPALVVLSEAEFEAAVREALRQVGRADLLADSPLTRSRVVVDARVDADVSPAEVLVDLLATAVDALRGDTAGEKAHRAVATTYFKGVPTQEAAAQRLGVPFSSYRRHLAAGVDGVVAWLWRRELHGSEATRGGASG